jgi:hypothetical protein
MTNSSLDMVDVVAAEEWRFFLTGDRRVAIACDFNPDCLEFVWTRSTQRRSSRHQPFIDILVASSDDGIDLLPLKHVFAFIRL